MKYLGFLVTFILTLILAVGLSVNFGQIPPMGILFDPYHGFWQNAYSEDERIEEELMLSGLSASVIVQYDEHLIPHVYANTVKDLMMAQGYVTAQHRLWQMEFQTMAAAGRISEMVGGRALEYDRMQRRKGLGFGAEMGLQYLRANDLETLRLIEAYTKGVNQYIRQVKIAELPVEYKILDYRPEPWTAYKTLLLLKYMADMLVGDKDLPYTNLRQQLGEDLMNRLFPDFPQEIDPVIESTKVWDFTPLNVQKPENVVYPDTEILQEPLPSPEPGTGSNNWAVSGSKTQSGFPILANDPHLNLNMPSLWYVMQLSTPEFSVKGATLPGALGVISGFNEDIAWGVTNAARDVRDWYAVTFRNKKRTEYLYNDQWIQSTLRVEEIQVRDDSAFVDSVIYTHHGPVVYDEHFKGNGQQVNFALKWTAHEGSNEQRTFLALNRAKDHTDYIQALEHFTSPAQNFAFACKDGDIALKVQGKFPLKWDGQGKYLMDGNDPVYEWKGYIPNEQNPATLNPARGFLSSANQHSAAPNYPYFIFDDSFEHYRNRRINSRLGEMEEITLEDMRSLQLDDFHLHASEVLPEMLAYFEEDTTQAIGEQKLALLDTLRDWDYHAGPHSSATTLFTIWWDHFKSLTWKNLPLKEDRTYVYPNNYQTTRLLKESPEDTLFDDPKTPAIETARELVLKSFEVMVNEIVEWNVRGEEYTWVNYKKTSIHHLVPDFKAFGFHHLNIGGGKGMVNATAERHGASWRMLVELGPEIRAMGIYPGGQSGNPGSKFYGNFVEKWAKGEYIDVSLRTSSQEGHLLFTTILKPEKE